MDMDRIAIRLTPFEKLQALRDENEERESELLAVEREIREKLFRIERQRYLEGVSPFYASKRGDIPSMDEIDRLEARRQQLGELLRVIEEQIPLLLQATDRTGAGAPVAAPETGAAAAGPARKMKFDSFDDFRRKQDA